MSGFHVKTRALQRHSNAVQNAFNFSVMTCYCERDSKKSESH